MAHQNIVTTDIYEKTGFVEDEEQENMGAAKTVNEVPEETPIKSSCE